MKMLLKLFKIIIFMCLLSFDIAAQTYDLCDIPVVINLRINGDGENFIWSTSDGEISPNGREAIINAYHEGNYNVLVKYVYNGCDYEITGKFVIDTCSRWSIWIPNAISPNGVNRTWMPKGENIRIDMIEIYDRWGRITWYGTEEFLGYNLFGNEIEGVFSYVINFTELIKNTPQRRLGSVVIIR